MNMRAAWREWHRCRLLDHFNFKFIGLIFSKFVYMENIDRDVILLRDNVVTRSGRAVIRPTRLDL